MKVAEATTSVAGDGIEVIGDKPTLGWKPAFIGDWVRAVFIHYEVEPAVLQREVPYELDLFEGRAFVSLVAFTMQRLRPRWGGQLAELLFLPIATTRYLNVRTYVRHWDHKGIYFIAEFLSNPLCVLLGRPTFGLPYRFGRLVYGRSGIGGDLRVARGSARLTCQVLKRSHAEFRPCRPRTLDAFLLERYIAFTCCGRARRLFHIWHRPWPQVAVEVSVRDEGLLRTTGRWIHPARVIGANFSTGVCDVWMEWPQRIESRRTKGGQLLSSTVTGPCVDTGRPSLA